jgi:hypothetical protein
MAKMIPIYSGSTQAEIERRARRLFEAAGKPANRDLDLWLQAESDFLKNRKQPQHQPSAVASP